MKIINPVKKSDFVTRHLHHFHGKFNTVISLYTKLIEEFKDQVPNNLTFAIGYLEGQKHSKVSIATDDDLRAMYLIYPSGEITLWCDARCEESSVNRKRKRAEVTSCNYHAEEGNIDEIYKELREKHSEKFDVPRLRYDILQFTSKYRTATKNSSIS